MKPRWLSNREQKAWRAYRRMKTLLDARLQRDLAEDSGLSEPDYDVLSTLSERSGHSWRSAELADRLLWSRSRLSHHVGRMERRGLVRRDDYDEDGRGALVVLTKKGMSTLEGAAPDHVESVRKNFIDVLSTRELESLRAIAEKVVKHID